MVRNPADMFHSLYWHFRQAIIEDAETPEEAWKLQEARKNDKNALRSLQYGETCRLGYQLKRVYDLVPKERVLVVFLDDLKKDARKVYIETLIFLGLSDDGRNDFPVINSRKGPYRIKFLQKLFIRISRLKNFLGIRKKFGVLAPIQKLNTKKIKNSSLSLSFREELIHYFREDIEKLSQITNKDLSHWTRV
jgi:hypothetical protein